MSSSTNDPKLKSFVDVAVDSHFPIQNLPYGVFTSSHSDCPQIGVAIGEQILNLSELERVGLLNLSEEVFQANTLNPFMDLGAEQWGKARLRISDLLSESCPILRDDHSLQKQCMLLQSEAKMQLPVAIGDYTDFYSSREHATNVGTMFRDKDNPLLPNWKHLPVGYHGRASSVVVSGTEVTRPMGQTLPLGEDVPQFSVCKRLDYELELAFFIGKSTELGQTLELSEARAHIFGLVLMNDWSARDIQKWEYQPLGPFVSKSFATSISPWVVPVAALEPFAVEGVSQDPQPLPYLAHTRGEKPHLDVNLEVTLKTSKVTVPHHLSKVSSKNLYWSMDQQVTHHTVSGCNLRTGDLMASGTVSGKEESERGCLLELSWGGKNPLKLGDERRTFIEDGDEVAMTGWCQGDGYRVGFGQVLGKVVPAKERNG